MLCWVKDAQLLLISSIIICASYQIIFKNRTDQMFSLSSYARHSSIPQESNLMDAAYPRLESEES